MRPSSIARPKAPGLALQMHLDIRQLHLETTRPRSRLLDDDGHTGHR